MASPVSPKPVEGFIEHPHTCPCGIAALWCALVAIALVGMAVAAHYNAAPFHEIDARPLFIASGVFAAFSLFMMYYVSETKKVRNIVQG